MKYGKTIKSFRPPKIKTIPIRSIGINGKSFRGKEKEEKAIKKIRNPVKYLMEKHGVPKTYAKRFLVQPFVIEKYWKEDNSGPYVHSDTLDFIGYGWNKERKEFLEGLESDEEIRKLAMKELRKDYGKTPSEKEMEIGIEKLPKKYQKGLRKTQRVMKVIKK